MSRNEVRLVISQNTSIRRTFSGTPCRACRRRTPAAAQRTAPAVRVRKIVGGVEDDQQADAEDRSAKRRPSPSKRRDSENPQSGSQIMPSVSVRAKPSLEKLAASDATGLPLDCVVAPDSLG
jgi:hypothetical protein